MTDVGVCCTLKDSSNNNRISSIGLSEKSDEGKHHNLFVFVLAHYQCNINKKNHLLLSWDYVFPKAKLR